MSQNNGCTNFMQHNHNEYTYLSMLSKVLYNGKVRDDRTGLGTRSTFGLNATYDLQDGFPLLTTKKMFWRGIVEEFLFFLRGEDNIKTLQEKNIHIWDHWTDENGYMGDGTYGRMWREWPGKHGTVLDQIDQLMHGLKNDPMSRRHLLVGYNPGLIWNTVLPPCFLEDSLVATNSSYVSISELNEDAVVLDGMTNGQKIERIYNTPYKGNIYKIKTFYDSFPIRCTPNHPFLVKDKGWVRADKLSIDDFLAIPRNIEKKLPSFTYGSKYNSGPKNKAYRSALQWTPTLNDFFVMGYFLGDGWWNGKKRVSFAINNRQRDWLLPKIRESIKVCKKKSNLENQGCHTYYTDSLKWSSALKDFGRGASNKKIPKWVLDAPHDYIRSFIDGYTTADGYIREKFIQYNTTSRSLAYGLQLLNAKIGKVSSVYFQKKPKHYIIEGRSVNQKDLYNISVIKDEACASKNFYAFSNFYLWVKIKNIDTTEYIGNVYNLNVENSHTYTVNNKVNHNCHSNIIQFYVDEDELSLQAYIRSNDLLLGSPFNIAMYGLMLELFSHQLGYKPKNVHYVIGDAHIYLNHIVQVQEQLSREVLTPPKLFIKNNRENVWDYVYEDFELLGYNYHPSIKANVAI